VPAWHWIVGLLEALCAFWVTHRYTNRLPILPGRQKKAQVSPLCVEPPRNYEPPPSRAFDALANDTRSRNNVAEATDTLALYHAQVGLHKFNSRQAPSWTNTFGRSIDVATPSGLKRVGPGDTITWAQWSPLLDCNGNALLKTAASRRSDQTR